MQRKLRVNVSKDHFGRKVDTNVPYRSTSTMGSSDGKARIELIVCEHNINAYRSCDLFFIWVEDVVDWETGEKLTIDQLDLPKKTQKSQTSYQPSKPKTKEPESTVVTVTVDGVEHDFYVTEYSKTLYEVKCDSLDNIEVTVEYKGKKETVKGKGAKKHRALIVQSVEEVK